MTVNSTRPGRSKSPPGPEQGLFGIASNQGTQRGRKRRKKSPAQRSIVGGDQDHRRPQLDLHKVKEIG